MVASRTVELNDYARYQNEKSDQEEQLQETNTVVYTTVTEENEDNETYRGREESKDVAMEGKNGLGRDDEITTQQTASVEREMTASTTIDDELPTGCTLYVRNLPTHLRDGHVRSHFNRHAEVMDCRIVVNPVTKESRGFGFITFKTPEIADQVLASTDQTEIEGRMLRVEKARRNKPHDPTPGEYKGPTGSSVKYDHRGRLKRWRGHDPNYYPYRHFSRSISTGSRYRFYNRGQRMRSISRTRFEHPYDHHHNHHHRYSPSNPYLIKEDPYRTTRLHRMSPKSSMNTGVYHHMSSSIHSPRGEWEKKYRYHPADGKYYDDPSLQHHRSSVYYDRYKSSRSLSGFVKYTHKNELIDQHRHRNR